MALQILPFPDIKYVLGQSGRLQAYQLQPQAADYVTGGYPITAAAVELGQLIGLERIGTNPAGIPYGVAFVPASISGTNPVPSASGFWVVTQAGVQVAAGTDLSGVTWTVLALGW